MFNSGRKDHENVNQKLLDRDLEISPPAPDRLAIVMQDEFCNTYEGCGYDDACSFKP